MAALSSQIIQTQTHTYTDTQTCTHRDTCTQTQVHAHTEAQIHIRTHTYTQTHKDVHMFSTLQLLSSQTQCDKPILRKMFRRATFRSHTNSDVYNYASSTESNKPHFLRILVVKKFHLKRIFLPEINPQREYLSEHTNLNLFLTMMLPLFKAQEPLEVVGCRIRVTQVAIYLHNLQSLLPSFTCRPHISFSKSITKGALHPCTR